MLTSTAFYRSLIAIIISLAQSSYSMDDKPNSQELNGQPALIHQIPTDVLPYLLDCGNLRDSTCNVLHMKQSCKRWQQYLDQPTMNRIIESWIVRHADTHQKNCSHAAIVQRVYDATPDLLFPLIAIKKHLEPNSHELFMTILHRTMLNADRDNRPEQFIHAYNILKNFGVEMKNPVDFHGHSLLHIAAHNKAFIWYLQILIDQKFYINQKDFLYGNTPLHEAVIAGNTEGVKLLLNHGARTDIKNSEGKCPHTIALEYAQELDDPVMQKTMQTISRLLVSTKFSKNSYSRFGTTRTHMITKRL